MKILEKIMCIKLRLWAGGRSEAWNWDYCEQAFVKVTTRAEKLASFEPVSEESVREVA